MEGWRRLDLVEIAAAIEAHRSSSAGAEAEHRGGPFTEDAARRLLVGFRYVDELLRDRVELFRYSGGKAILELNNRVLCGTTPERRAQYERHIAETRARFYDSANEGFGAIFGWIQRNRSRAPRTFAGGLYVQIVSMPQLFIEGNRRTASLLASYVLARGGLPPLVVRPEILGRYQAASEACLGIDRSGGIGSMLATLQASRRMSGFLAETGDARFLAPATDGPTPGAVPAPGQASSQSPR